jgi:hypothetical protein
MAFNTSYAPAWKKFGSGKADKAPKLTSTPEEDNEPTLNSEDDEKPVAEATMIHINKPEGKIKVEHKDGTKSDHEFEGLSELKDKLDKFFGEEEKEFKKNPEDEDEYHKGSLGEDDEDDSHSFADMLK